MDNYPSIEESPAYKKVREDLARWDALSVTYRNLEAKTLALKERFEAIDDELRWMQTVFRGQRKASERL